ncbi:DUF4825 domain-containing protein [Brevibacillus parabrevis]|uniref:DUF4825 domain-containing protein n=1 Tax=Brevibacillus parabrevis TaxID=54914 RepID=UPI0028533104|nr:DUF4825 domain-containing protein [Brevibacillus parabrevis]MDR4998328.1 DUF4825 domain-containing protein [Brevibacillus parabrevis]
MRTKLIVLLAVIGLGMFALIQGVIIPDRELAAKQYLEDQQNPLTHDLQTILPYKHKYMGAVSNLNLFNHLPLSNERRSFQLRPEQFAIEVKYEASELRSDEKKIRQALLYNSVAAFALIDNLQIIEYQFVDETLTIARADVQKAFGDDLKSLLTTDKWRSEVQKKWRDEAFLAESVKLLQEKRQ